MTPKQQAILGPWLKATIRRNGHAWWSLKREFHDGGLPSPLAFWSSTFLTKAEAFIAKLPEQDKQVLVAEWRRMNSVAPDQSDEGIINVYPHVIVEEIHRRAELAAMRTINW
jgi:hypothetical protein